MPTSGEQNKTFYECLQMEKALDLRDNRGKRHDLSLILLGVVLALLRKRDGVLSSIHRSMVNTHSQLCEALGVENTGVISRPQLPNVLAKVNISLFSSLLFSHYGLKLSHSERKWFAADGKELCGSIAKGKKRGEALVQVVAHEDGSTVAQDFYNGRKQSEKPAIRKLLSHQGLLGQGLSLDALHMNPATLRAIAQAEGIFLVGLKKNQKELEADMRHLSLRRKPIAQDQTIEKGHGRLDIRHYEAFCVKNEYFDQRWLECGFTTLIKVKRERTLLKEGKTSSETAFFLSNEPSGQNQDLFQAVRGHWAVETNNHIRDVTLDEDRFRSSQKEIARSMASIRTLIVRILQTIRPPNLIAQIENYQDNFALLINDLRQIQFL
ncbi:MAG: ISAs1 family transposase [Bacteroidetes bacterium]|nr:ISAs1 family transposase [Bacteroidota bacterium]